MVEEKITSEQIQAARAANLADYFQRGGYETELVGRELHVKNYGGLYVNVDTGEWYCFSQEDKHGGRNAVNCLTDIVGLDFKSAVRELSGDSFSYTYPRDVMPAAPKKQELIMPERASDMRKVFAYLCQTRKIDGELVSELAHNGLLYQDKLGNAVFIHKDDNGEIIGAEIQGTNSYRRYKGVAKGTSDSIFSYKIGEPNRAYIFESAIDLLSFKMLADQNKIQNCVLVSMAGLKPNSLKPLAEKGLRLYACVDNDEAGMAFAANNNLKNCNRILSERGVKDFNELLQKVSAEKMEQRKAPPKKSSHSRR